MLVAVTAGVFSGRFDHPYVVFPLLAWAALRFRHRGAATATLLIASVAVVRTAAGVGPFAAGDVTQNLWVLDTFLAVVALTGLILASVVSERDRALEETQRLSEQLEIRVAELQVANKELEAFTYTVSHDLRAPLRNIDGFARMLGKRLDASVDPDAHHYLDVVRRNAKAMGTLIDELLAFSRLQRQELRTQPVDVAAVVEDALALHDAERAGRDVEIVVDALPAAVADRGLLTQVYSNLIGNALKFSRGRAPARVEIGATAGDDGRGPVYFVRDNGVGFDMAYVDKLFGVFQRLHRLDDFEGSGVGLAIVARIVARHGGRVWAEGRPDAGATVFFTLTGATT